METTRQFSGLRRAAVAVVGLTAVALTAVAGCNPSTKPVGTTGPAPTPITQAFTQAEYNNQIDEIRTAAHSAPLIFVGTMSAIGSSPGVWSGHIPAHQPVTYSNVRVLKGSHREASALVHQPVVYGSMTADSSSPQLSPAMFSAGNSAIVFVHYRRGRLVAEDSQVGTIPHDADNEAAVMALLSP